NTSQVTLSKLVVDYTTSQLTKWRKQLRTLSQQIRL
ncbi:hypothetical protein SpAB1_13120, partial [Streptococcus pyogenes]